MSPFTLIQLPTELIYLIFRCMRKSDVIYAFYALNERFAAAIRFFIGKKLDLTNVPSDITLYILIELGSRFHSLAIGGRSFDVSTSSDCLTKYCTNLETLVIFCTPAHYDVRDYLQFLHLGLASFRIADEQRQLYPNVALHLHSQSHIQTTFVYRHLTLNFTENGAFNIAMLEWHLQSVDMLDGLYRIENIFGHKYLEVQAMRVCIGDGPLEQGIFRLEHVRYREYRLRHYLSNRIIHIYQQSLNHEAPLVLDSHADQTLTFERAGSNADEYYIWPAHQLPTRREKVLDVYNYPDGCARQNAAQVQLYGFHGGPNQRFCFHPVDESALTCTGVAIKKPKKKNWLHRFLPKWHSRLS